MNVEINTIIITTCNAILEFHSLPSSHACALSVEKPSKMDETCFKKQHRSHIKVEEDTVPHFLVTKPFTWLPNLHTFLPPITCTYDAPQKSNNS
jgi:hypothetical protein